MILCIFSCQRTKKKIQCIFSSKKDKKNIKFERGVLIGLILESMG